jgi:hypothetical protein
VHGGLAATLHPSVVTSPASTTQKPGHEQELKALKDQAKRAGKKSKDEFKQKEIDLVAAHKAELEALDNQQAPVGPCAQDEPDGEQVQASVLNKVNCYIDAPVCQHAAAAHLCMPKHRGVPGAPKGCSLCV